MSLHESVSKLSVGASIVIYRTCLEVILPLAEKLLAEGVDRVYLVDNSPVPTQEPEKLHLNGRITLIRTGINLGYGRAHNIAIRESVLAHRYHLVCNPDIEPVDGVILVLAAFMEKHPECSLCMPKIFYPDGKIQKLCKRVPTPFDLLLRRFTPHNFARARKDSFEMSDFDYDKEMRPLILSGCFMFFKSSDLQKLGGFDDRFFMYLEDFDLSLRAAQLGSNWFVPGVSVVHQHTKESYKSVRMLATHIMSACKFFWKWGWDPTKKLGVEVLRRHDC